MSQQEWFEQWFDAIDDMYFTELALNHATEQYYQYMIEHKQEDTPNGTRQLSQLKDR